MKSIPVAMRERILKLYDQDKSTVEIAAFCGFCVAAVRRVRQHFQARGTVEPQTHLCGRKTLLTAPRQARLQKLVADQPDATLAELGARLDRPFGTSTVDVWRRRLGLSHKKKRCTPPSSAARTWPNKGRAGTNNWRRNPPPGSCSWMKAGPTPR
jgi:transposase